MTATTTPATGDIITARPWVSGYEVHARKGVVVSVDGDYLIVWFYGMGPLGREEDGHAVQAILTKKAVVTGNIAGWRLPRIKQLSKTLYRDGRSIYAPLFNLCYSVARTVAS